MKRFLLIDTAGEPASAGIATARKVLAETTVADRRQLSETLLERVDALTREAKTPLAELSGIGVVTGPGPFTGLRIGVSVANALAYANELPIVPLAAAEAPSLEAAAALVAEREAAGRTEHAVLPTYGREPTITPPRER